MPVLLETGQVTEAKRALIDGLTLAIAEKGLTRDEAEASLSYFFSGAWNEVETKVVRKLTDPAWSRSPCMRARKD